MTTSCEVLITARNCFHRSIPRSASLSYPSATGDRTHVVIDAAPEPARNAASPDQFFARDLMSTSLRFLISAVGREYS